MADIPRPDNFSSFTAWINAVLSVSTVTQVKIAAGVGCSQQAVGLWKRGGKINREHLKKLAQWAGVDYFTLSALVDDQPLSRSRKAKLEATLRRHPEVERIAAMLDTISGDESGLRMARALIHELVSERQQMQRARAKNE